MGPEYVTTQINSRILELLLRRFDFSTVSEILICFSLIKHFPNYYKRYSSRLHLSIVHRVASMKLYLTIYESIKNSYLKKVSIPQINIFR